MIIQLASFNSNICKSSNISNESPTTWNLHLYVVAHLDFTQFSLGIGFVCALGFITWFNIWWTIWDQLNQVFNADGTYKQSPTFWWYPNKFGSSQVRSDILRQSLSMSSGMFCNSNHRGTIIILPKHRIIINWNRLRNVPCVYFPGMSSTFSLIEPSLPCSCGAPHCLASHELLELSSQAW